MHDFVYVLVCVYACVFVCLCVCVCASCADPDFFSWPKGSGSFQAGIGKPGTQNPGPGQVLKLCFVPSRIQKCDVVTKSSHLYQVPGKSSHFWKYLKKLFRNLAAFERHSRVTSNLENDENVTSHPFVTVPHSNPGPDSGKIPAWNDPESQWSVVVLMMLTSFFF